MELLRWAIAEGIQAPLILLTGQGAREIDIEAMRAGAVLDVCSEKFAKRLNEVVKKSEHFDLADDPNFAMNFAMGMYFS